MKNEYLKEQDLSEMLEVSLSTLRSMRVKGGGVNFIKVGRLVRYPISEVERYLASRLVNSTTQYKNEEKTEVKAKFADHAPHFGQESQTPKNKDL